MLLLHQVGSVKIGELVRYTVTYTPSADRILPSPEFLYLRIKNTCAIALRAAFVHGPYTLSTAAYPSTFNPNQKFEDWRRYGIPEFEPMLKAGGTWNCQLVVPENIRQGAGEGSSRHGQFGNGPEHEPESVTWIIEVTSQVIFSTSAAVHYEILLARDEDSLSLGSSVPVIGGHAQVPQPGRVSDFQQSIGGMQDHAAQPKGVFSRAIRLKVEDTATLWNTPQLPGYDEAGWLGAKHAGADVPVEPVRGGSRPGEPRVPKKQKRVHLVVVTHGLHSNLGADMLYLKESIDAGVKQARIDAKARKARERAARREKEAAGEGQAADGSASAQDDDEGRIGGEEVDGDDDEDDDEEVIVRGFSGNATKTEKGIKFLGKRLARFILSMTYPDQPFLPTARGASETIANTLKPSSQKQDGDKQPAHKHSTVVNTPSTVGKRPYRTAKISFIAHSLGGLVQTYAVAYIQKHSPRFFDLIEPVNFIALASPFLGLNHENPLYVKFALDFGLVGRTGQDLGLTWRAPTIARSGWGALVSNLGENAHKHVYGDSQPESKPLLRILPTGPAHTALRKFRNRTVYSNVVNDGIVPLRTSCLLFLDWQGLGRVEKARREVGLVETVVRSGWAELTGANVTSPRLGPWAPAESEDKEKPDDAAKPTPVETSESHEVPQPSTNATLEDDRQSLRSFAIPHQEGGPSELEGLQYSSNTNNANPLSGIFNFFRSNNGAPKPPPAPSQKQNKIYQDSQVLMNNDQASTSTSSTYSKSRVTPGYELTDDGPEGMSAPPKTTFFESAGDLLNPTLPSVEYLIDPSKRPRAIFHDRIYHPSDIPPPPLKKRPTSSPTLRRRSKTRTTSSTETSKTGNSEASSPFLSPVIPHQDSTLSQRDYDDTIHTNPDMDPSEMIDSSQMRVEEKIARAYHRGLSWRKVLVKLEPDAHNNIIVRRMFANAFGWPVVNHLVEAHFSDSVAARTPDEHEHNEERAKPPNEAPNEQGAETSTQEQAQRSRERPREAVALDSKGRDSRGRTQSEAREATDTVSDLLGSPKTTPGDSNNPLGLLIPSSPSSPRVDRLDSMTWSERDWASSGDDDDYEDIFASIGHHQNHDEKKKGKDNKGVTERSSSPLRGWNWTEKIVGKGATQRPGRSLRGPKDKDKDSPEGPPTPTQKDYTGTIVESPTEIKTQEADVE
ncbi:putative serine esterase-domain-containing protein [Diplogelasinospora grovesii]|uniref:Serine esterase-domain-containing protein n=1 Tax=Diplogelasinospora grovesii TaxID=303347 RepID=A0AAN6N1Q6_9PEZI|nr:putative serine esterase-domain-containing protein [Diplogelasinospora grovesii]